MVIGSPAWVCSNSAMECVQSSNKGRTITENDMQTVLQQR